MDKELQKMILQGSNFADLSNISFTEEEFKSFVEQSPQLTSVKIGKADWIKYLDALPHLDSVIMDSCHKKETIIDLSRLKNLRHLELYNCQFMKEDFYPSLEKLTNISSLSLRWCDELDDRVLHYIATLKNVTSLEIEEAYITNEGIKTLSSMSQLTSLSFTNANDKNAIWEDFSTLDNLQEFFLKDCAITELGIINIVSNKTLTKLDLRPSFEGILSNTSLELISFLEHLSELCIENCKGFDENGLHHLSKLVNLTSLRFEIDTVAIKDLNFLANLTQLRHLSLRGLFFVDSLAFSFLTELKKLEILKLGHIDEGVTRFLSNLPNLHSIDLSSTGIKDTDLLCLSEIPNLNKLNLTHCSITDHGINYLARAEHLVDLNLSACPLITGHGFNYQSPLKNLKILNLSACPLVSDQGLTSIGSLKSLKSLSLMNCSLITDQGLSHLVGMENLTTLNLNNCRLITDEGLKYISSLKNLRDLDLYYCELIRDKGMLSICNLSNLRSIELKFTRITNVGGELLEKCLPNTRVSRIHYRKKRPKTGEIDAG